MVGLILSVLVGSTAGCKPNEDALTRDDATSANQRPDRAGSPPSPPIAGTGPTLLPDPRIINVHEHLMKSSLLAGYGRACEAVGIAATVFVGSSGYTLHGGRSGFDEHHINNEFLCSLARIDPQRVYAWITFDPQRDDMVPQLEKYLAQGATGVKLYLGHTGKLGNGDPFHCMELDDPRMIPLYDFCDARRVPILAHINAGRFREEFERLLDRYPDLPWIIPHYMVLGHRLERLSEVLDRYPGVMVDQSFGTLAVAVSGLKRISRRRDEYREFYIRYQDRILFGTDAVITAARYKTVDYLTRSFMVYRHMLELDEYVIDIEGQKGETWQATLRGLHLPESVVRKIYRENFARFCEESALPSL